jgi:23S rRNA (adenine2503-C2)-methyltransferase
VGIDLTESARTAVRIQRSLDGSLKYRFPLGEGLSTEAAYFSVPGRDISHIACVSTQLGCAAHCRFCSTAASGLFRSLSAEEILLQVTSIVDHAIACDVPESDVEVSFMGMGEPLANQRNLLDALSEIHRRYPAIRRVALSTVGPAWRVIAFADKAEEYPKPIHLQLSLHATTDCVRRRLIPHAPDSIEQFVDAGLYYHRRTGDRVCLNYILLEGLNGSESDATWFERLDRSAFWVKLTVLNDILGMPGDLRAASEEKFMLFSCRLTQYQIAHKVFRGDGLDVRASCGQLAARPTVVWSHEPEHV